MKNFSFTSLKGRDRFLLIVLGVVIFCLSWFQFLYSSKKAEIDAQEMKRQQLETELTTSRAAAAQLPGLQLEVEKLRLQRDELLQSLPVTARIGAVLGEIRGNILAAGAEMQTISQSGGQANGLPAGVRPIGITLSVKGTFSETYRVLRSLEDMSRFSTINALSVNLGQADSFDPKLTSQLGVTIYTFDPNAAGGAAPTGAAGNATPAPTAPPAPPAGGTQ